MTFMIFRFVQYFSVVASLFLIFTPALTMAQDEPKKDAAESTPQEPTTEPEPMTQPDEMPGMEATDTPPAKDAAKPDAPKTESKKEMSYLEWMLRSSGPIGFVLFAMSFLAVGLTIKFIMEMKRDKVIPPQLVMEFENKIRDKKYQDAYEVARNNPSFLGKVLAAGLSKLSTGYPQAIEAMHEVGEDESMRLEHRLSWLAILGTVGPLLGLVGTVEGIIASFRVIATSETQPKPSALAGGISTSLFNTFEGLLVAIIATIAFMLLKNHMARLVLEVGMVSGNLMSRISNVVNPGRSSASVTATEQS
jgi:biopolymer transport protein ExbB